MDQITVNFPPETLAFLRRTAEREFRTVSAQIRFMIEDAAKRAASSPPVNCASNSVSAGDNPSGNPPLPVVNPENIEAVKAELAALEAERDQLQAQQDQLGYRFLPESDARLRFLYGRCSAIRTHVQTIERFMGVRT